MGRLIRKKLQSQRGVSLVMAMLFLLVSATVGAIVLSASSANAGHIHSSWEEQREYLAISSAVTLLREDFQQLEFTGSYTATRTTITYGEDEVEGEEEKPPTTPLSVTTYSFQKGPELTESGNFPLTGSTLLGENINQRYLDFGPTYLKFHTQADWGARAEYAQALSAAPEPVKEFALCFDASTAEVDLPVVMGTLKAITGDPEDHFTIQVELYVTREDEPDYKSYVTVMEFTPKLEESQKTAETVKMSGKDTIEKTEVTHVLKVTWNEPEIGRGA